MATMAVLVALLALTLSGGLPYHHRDFSCLWLSYVHHTQGTKEESWSVFEDDLLLGPNPAEARSFVFSSFLNEAATATLSFKEKEEDREPDTHSHGHRARIVCLHIDLFYFGKQPKWDDGQSVSFHPRPSRPSDQPPNLPRCSFTT